MLRFSKTAMIRGPDIGSRPGSVCAPEEGGSLSSREGVKRSLQIALKKFAPVPARWNTKRAVKLLIVHHHFRPGGVRRVIELATPHLVKHWPARIRAVVLATGERPDSAWLRAFRGQLPGLPVKVLVLPPFGYASEWSPDGRSLKQAVLEGVLELLREAGASPCLIWAHNLGLGRNLDLARELTFTCHCAGIPLLVHHHDWWFENRWHHFAALREPGFRKLDAVARAVLAVSPQISHLAINQADAAILQKHFGRLAGWLPNPLAPARRLAAHRVQAARAWLGERLGQDAPVWILPARLLRRKNVAEALLLTRWLRPEAWLVTTGRASSAEEQPYAEALAASASIHQWRLRLGILHGDEGSSRAPSVPELLAASEVVLLTSLQEGFGLPYLEATALRRPLLARMLPNIAPDLAKFGFRFPQSYREVRVAPSLFDWEAERERQARLFTEWKRLMPRAAARFVGSPALLAEGHLPCPAAFSRLTLTAQLEVLAQPPERSWEQCAPLNPFLRTWRTLASSGELRASAWPHSAARWLGGRAYARRFLEFAPPFLSRPPGPGASQAAQGEFFREKLRAENLYPLLWSLRT
jgi:glycosyltransferase involved in cell wall biosynthesis